MKKLLALILAGAMVASMGIMAYAEADSSNGEDVYKSIFNGNQEPSKESIENIMNTISDTEYCDLNEYLKAWKGENWMDVWNTDWESFLFYPSAGPSCDSSSGADDDTVFDRGSEAEALAIEATGIPMTTTLAAAEENKSVGEYMNNAVVAAPGLDNAVPVSQGGNVIINGAPSNQTFSVLKVLSGHTDSAKAQAASVGGRVLNVARIDASVYFDTATVNFYMPGVKTGQNIQVYQYDYANGQWTGVAVAEVREDHVVVDMTSLGVLAFIEVPAAE